MMETAYQRTGREQRERQAARAERMAAEQRKKRKSYSASSRIADRIDGYDRDNLGLSADY